MQYILLFALSVYGILFGQEPSADEWPIIHNVHQTGFSPTTDLRPPLKIKWMTKIPAQIQLMGPVVAEHKVVIQDLKGYLFCLDAETGELIWRHYIPGAVSPTSRCSSPCIWNGGVYSAFYVPTKPDLTGIRCYDLNTGELRFVRYSGYAPASVSPSPQVSNGRLYFLSNVDINRSTTTQGLRFKVRLQCWNAITGDSIWVRDVFDSACINTSFLVANDTIYTSVAHAKVNWVTDTGRTVIYDRDGNIIWESSVKSHHLNHFNGNLQYQPGKLWIPTDSGIQIISTRDHSFILHNGKCSTGSYTIFALMNGKHWETGYAELPYAYDDKTGAPLYRARLFTGDAYLSGCLSPVAANGFVYKGYGGPGSDGHPNVPFSASKLYAFDENGNPVWSFPSSTHWCNPPAIAYDRLYAVTSGEGVAYCFENAQ